MYLNEKGYICVADQGGENCVSFVSPKCSPYGGRCCKKLGCKVVQLNINSIKQTATVNNGCGNSGVSVPVNVSWISSYPLATGCFDQGCPFPLANGVEVREVNLNGQNIDLDSKDINVRIDEEGNVFLNGEIVDENNPNFSVATGNS